MHYLSRFVFFLLQPSHLVLLMIAAGVLALFWRRTWKIGRTTAACGLAMLLVLGFTPFGHAVLLPLEQRFSKPAAPPQNVVGIIILGGFEDGNISHARGMLTLNEAAERLTKAVMLSHTLPATKVIFTGGSGEIFRQGRSGAGAVGEYLQAAGIPSSRILLEPNSRNTYENAIFTRNLVQPKTGDRWLLVTSASHMPRAMGTFRQAGFNVIAYPVDYRTRGTRDLTQPFTSLAEGLRRADMAAREWLGLLVYRLTRRTSTLWPAPTPDGPTSS